MLLLYHGPGAHGEPANRSGSEEKEEVECAPFPKSKPGHYPRSLGEYLPKAGLVLPSLFPI